MKPRKRLFFYLIENDIEDFYYKNPEEKEFVRADEKGAGKWKRIIGKARNIPTSVIRTANFFPVIKAQIRRISTACSVIVPYNEKGFKDCTNCQLPHKRKNYGYVTGKYQELADLMKKVRENQDVKEK